MLLSNYKESSTHRIQVYGPPKSGKTLLVGKLAEKFKLKWIDLEKGVQTLVSNLPTEWLSNIELIQIPDNKQFPIAVETLSKILTYAPVNICEQHGKVSCPICIKEGKPSVKLSLRDMQTDEILVIDSATQLTDSAIAHITRGKPDDYKLERDDWGDLSRIMSSLFSQIQQAPCNIVVITHETLVETEDGKSQKLVPVTGSGNFSRNVAKYFDDVIYCQLKNAQHRFGSATTYQLNTVTGSRSNAKLEDMKEPSLLPIFDGSLSAAASIARSKVGDAAVAESKLKKLLPSGGLPTTIKS